MNSDLPEHDTGSDDRFVRNLVDGAAETESSSPVRVLRQQLKIEGYEILRELHRGGQGLVYQAVQKSTKRKVAIKVLLAGPLASHSARKRFEREIELVAQLKHPNIIVIFDSGATAAGDQYCVMDYIRGRHLNQFVREKKLTLEQTLELFAHVCDAVQFAHQRGVIHRDLKPSNVMVGSDGAPKVLDFGLAKSVSSTDTVVSMTGHAFGTLPYMSPEQTRGDPDEIDTRTDVYSLGVILYELLTGGFPYEVRGQMADVLRNIAEANPTPPSDSWNSDFGVTRRSTGRLRPGRCPIDEEVRTIVIKTLSKEPERRYQSAGDLAADIRRYLKGEAVEARRDSSWYVLRKALRRNRLSVSAVVAFGILLIAFAIMMTAQSTRIVHQRDEALAAQRWAERMRDNVDKQREKLRRANYFNSIALALGAHERRDFYRVRMMLSRCPQDLRGWEWHYLDSASDQSLRTSRDSWKWVRSVPSPTGGEPVVLACASRGTGFRISNAITGREIMQADLGDLFFTDSAVSSDGKRLVSGARALPNQEPPNTGGRIAIWDLQTGRKLMTVAKCSSDVFCVAFSPDGRCIVSGNDGPDAAVRIWSVQDGRLIATMRGRHEEINQVIYSPDGAQIVSVSMDGEAKVWDSASGEQILALDQKLPGYSRVSFSPDGSRILGGSMDETVRVWDATTGRTLRAFQGHNGYVLSASYSPDEKWILSTGADCTVRLWDAETGELKRTFRGHLLDVWEATFSSDGHRIFSVGGNALKVWDPTLPEAPILHEQPGTTGSVGVSPDGRWIVSGNPDGTLAVFDAYTYLKLRTIQAHQSDVTSVSFDPHGTRILTSSFDNTVNVWDALTGRSLLELHSHDDRVNDAEFSPDGKLIASAGTDKTIRIWNAATGTPLRVIQGHDANVLAIAFGSTGERIASCSEDGHVRVWDVSTAELVFGTNEGANVDTNVGTNVGRDIAFSPDGRQLATSVLNATVIRNAENGQILQLCRPVGNAVNHFAFTPDGKRLVCGGSDHNVRLFDSDTGDEAITLSGHRFSVIDLAVSADGNTIVSRSADGEIRIWRANRRERTAMTAQ